MKTHNNYKGTYYISETVYWNPTSAYDIRDSPKVLTWDSLKVLNTEHKKLKAEPASITSDTEVFVLFQIFCLLYYSVFLSLIKLFAAIYQSILSKLKTYMCSILFFSLSVSSGH